MAASKKLGILLGQGAGPIRSSIPVAFGTSVAISSIAFLGGLSAISFPGPLFLSLLLGAFLVGGWVASRSHLRGMLSAAACGCVAALITLVILGGLFLEDSEDRSAALPLLRGVGFICLGTVLATVGGALAMGKKKPPTPVIGLPL